MNWNQPKCDECWNKENPDRVASRVVEGPLEKCSNCGKSTTSGIYVRAHPDSVNFPASEDD